MPDQLVQLDALVLADPLAEHDLSRGPDDLQGLLLVWDDVIPREGSISGIRGVSSRLLISSHVKTSQPRALKPAMALSPIFSAFDLP